MMVTAQFVLNYWRPPLLSNFEPLEFNPVAADMGKLVGCARWMRQPSSVPPKTFAVLTAVSGEIRSLPFTSSKSVLRATVILKPKGSMHCRRTKPPGCGGFFIVVGRPPSLVVIAIINN